MKRRDFIKTAGYAATGAIFPEKIIFDGINQEKIRTGSASREESYIKVDHQKMFVETKTLSAVLEKGIIRSLKDKSSGEEFILSPDINTYRALQLVYPNETINANEEKFGNTIARQISDKSGIYFSFMDGDGVLVSVDEESGYDHRTIGIFFASHYPCR